MPPDEATKRDVALRQWLSSLGLEQYAESFERNDVGLDLLADLSEAKFEKLGLTLGHRKRLLTAVGGFQSTESVMNADKIFKDFDIRTGSRTPATHRLFL